MDAAGSFRAQRPSAQRQAVPHQAQISQTPRTEAHAVQHRAVPQHPSAVQSSAKRFIIPIVAVVAVLLIGLIGWFFWSRSQAAGFAVDTSKYQAVFFTNGQVYFGKLQPAKSGYMKLTDVYYLQNQVGAAEGSENPQTAATDQSSVQLIKLGEEIHGPEDAMIISKDQVLFYENLKPDGKVAQSIDRHKSAN